MRRDWVRYLVFGIALLIFLLVAQTCSNPGVRPAPTGLPSPIPTPTPVMLTHGENLPTVTPLPAELLENRDQTNGIILGSAFLVLIIIGGTLSALLRRRKT